MRKLQLSVIGSAFVLLGLVPQKANAQIETSIGGMLAYGSEISSLGIGVSAEFGVMEKLAIAPSFIYYLPKSEGPVKYSRFEINANANYYFLMDQKFEVYGLAGLNYSSVNVEYDGPSSGFGFSRDVSSGSIGFNIGIGGNLNLSNSGITPFAQLKYTIIDAGQFVIMGGVKFDI